MAFSLEERDVHYRMLREWVETLKIEGYNVVTAQLPEYVDKPKPVSGGPVPDLVAKDSDDSLVIGQVKTAEDIKNEHTGWQLRNYGRTCSKVMLLVPKRYVDDAVDMAESLGCDSVEIWTHD